MEWMAWTIPTTIFFSSVFFLLVTFGLLHWKFPSRARTGLLGIETQRGDRLFITLLGSAFINLAWLGLTDTHQWTAIVFCFIFAFIIFRWV